MAELTVKLWNFFCDHASIWKDITEITGYRTVILAILFGLAALLGFWAFRVYFSLSLFLTFVAVSVALSGSGADWQHTVAFFSVVGVILAYLSFRWPYFASYFMSSAIGAMVGYLISGELIGAILFGTLFLGLSVLFPLHTVCAAMSLFGALGLASLFEIHILWSIPIFLAGFGLQLFIARKQTLFGKIMPDAVRYRLEKRKSNAAGV